MNERIKELAEQAGFDAESKTVWVFDNFDLERFADLFLEAERKEAAEHYLKIMRDAVKIEREACAKLCDLVAREADDTDGLATYIGKAIRARSNHE